MFLSVKIYGIDLNCLIDTGATVSILHPEKYYAIPEKYRPSLGPYKSKLRMGDGALVPALGCSITPLDFNGQLIPQKMIIANIDVSGVLGYDFLYENAVDINIREGSLRINGMKMTCKLESKLPSIFRVTIGETVTIPANSEMIIQGKVDANLTQQTELSHVIVEPESLKLTDKGVLVAKTLAEVDKGTVLLRSLTSLMIHRPFMRKHSQQTVSQSKS